MKKIPVIIPYITQDEHEAIGKVLESGWVAQGPKVAEFEKEIAKHEGVAQGVATSSCTTALYLAMAAMDMKEGMDVIAPSFTFVATVNSIVSTGATPILVDIKKDTYNIDTDEIIKTIQNNYDNINGKLINNQTKNVLWGIVPVHQFGLCSNMPVINKIAKKYDLKIIEDAACAIGASINGQHQGAFGNTSCISFHPRKSITTGEGGMVLTDDVKLADKMRMLRTHGASVSASNRHKGKGFLLPEFNTVGYNYRMTDIQAAMGLAQAKKLDYILETRNKRADIYNELINKNLDFLIPPKVHEGYTHSYQSYVCMLDKEKLGFESNEKCGDFRNELLSILEDKGVSTRQGTHAVHLLSCYKKLLNMDADALPNAYECHELSVTLPLYVQMSDEDQRYVIDILKETYENLKKQY